MSSGDTRQFIEVVGEDMPCFKVDAETLEPTGSSYYEPAARRDPQGRRQMSLSAWQVARNEQHARRDYRYD